MVGHLPDWIATTPGLEYAAITTLSCVPVLVARFQFPVKAGSTLAAPLVLLMSIGDGNHFPSQLGRQPVCCATAIKKNLKQLCIVKKILCKKNDYKQITFVKQILLLLLLSLNFPYPLLYDYSFSVLLLRTS